MHTREEIEAAVAAHYTQKMNGKVSCVYDEDVGAYCIQGRELPAHPDMQDTYPNGWQMLDYVAPGIAQEIANNHYNTLLNDAYAAWRVSYQSSEQAARAAFAECERLRYQLSALRGDIAAIIAQHDEPPSTG